MRRIGAAILALVASLTAAEARADAAMRGTFIARHRCAILARLETIHRRGPPDTSRDRFIAVALRDRPHHYVQCIFLDRDRQMLCEAASGAYGPAGGDRLRLEADALAALRTLAFVQADPHENFSRTVDLGSPPDLGIAADLMLATLYDVYGARDGTPLLVEAPRGGDPETVCGTPVS